jgi:hypothetical protein
MDGNRLFMIGVVVLLLGIQFRVVESFELNEWSSQVVEKRFPSTSADPATSYLAVNTYNDPWLAPVAPSAPATRVISPPRPLALSFISVGAIMILVSPAYRK